MMYGVLLSVALSATVLIGVYRGEADAPHVIAVAATRNAMELGFPRIKETSKYFEIVFSEEPESRLFVHSGDRFIAVAQPGRRTVAPSIEQVEDFSFAPAEGVLVVQWRDSQGTVETASFAGVDTATWERLKAFVTLKLGARPEMREQTPQR
jgi:hypothetical protein